MKKNEQDEMSARNSRTQRWSKRGNCTRMK